MRSNFLWSTSLLVVVIACSGSTSTTPQQACTDVASSICNKLESCYPFDLALLYGDVATCTARAAIDCPAAIGAAGSVATAANLEACSQAYAAISCGDLVAQTRPPACEVPGTLAAGSPCGSDLQCAGSNGYCKVSTGTCGVCSTRSAAGGPCVSTPDCQSGLACSLGACVTPGAAGATCSATQPCEGDLACQNGVCDQPLAAGAKCGPTTSCNALLGDYCAPSGVCTQAQSAAPGAACGLSTTGFTECAKGTCKMAVASTTGTCESLAADGAACNAATGPGCLTPATCVNGACTIASPASCN